MIKIPCFFQREFPPGRRPVLLRNVTPGCEWAADPDGDARPTRKRDGTACLVREGRLFKRLDVRIKRGAMVPADAIPCTPAPDPITGHWPHWVEVGPEPESRWHMEAWTGLRASDGARFRPRAALPDGTYELCGPKIGSNHERLDEHMFFRHGAEVLDVRERDWDSLRTFLGAADLEGIVFHHPDGRMCKIRRDDYGFPWPLLP